jgi:GNAT superfamily N-acetyltransferase
MTDAPKTIARLKSLGIPALAPVHRADGVRYFAHIAAANSCYVEKLVITAMPNLTDECPKVIGQLIVNVSTHLGRNNCIEWIEVDPEFRRRGIGREMWRLAERLLERTHEHFPVTDEGEAFANAMERNAK